MHSYIPLFCSLVEYYGRLGSYGATIVYGIALLMFCMNYFVSYDNVIDDLILF